jgi:hypothetical protein
MKITLRTIAALAAAFLLLQCTEEEIQVTKKEITTNLQGTRASSNSANAFTIGATPLYDYDDQIAGYDFLFYMKGSGSITIYWGDGSKTYHQFTDSWDTFTHGYPTNGEYQISITGDYKSITYFDTYYGQGPFKAIDFRRLTNLEEVSIGLTESSKVIDLSHNAKLSRVSLAGMQDLETLILPKRHNIRMITLDGPFKFDTSDVDEIVDNIYKNAVAQHITGGYFTLYREWYQEEGDFSMIGPPSAASMEKLNALKNNYGWTIGPSADSQNM